MSFHIESITGLDSYLPCDDQTGSSFCLHGFPTWIMYVIDAFYLFLFMCWLCGVVLWLSLLVIEVKQRWARLVHGWVTVHDRSRFVDQWGVLMQPKTAIEWHLVVRPSGIVNWLIYLFIYLFQQRPCCLQAGVRDYGSTCRTVSFLCRMKCFNGTTAGYLVRK